MTLGKIFICLTFVEIQFSSVGIEANRGQSLGKHKSISGQTTALQQQLDAVQFTLYSDLCSLIKFLKSWFVQFLCQTTALASCMMYIIQKKYVCTFYLKIVCAPRTLEFLSCSESIRTTSAVHCLIYLLS